MKTATSKDFISMVSEEKPAVCFYHKKEEDAQVKKTKEILLKIKKEYVLLPMYEFLTDANPDNEQLCEVLEIADRPMLIIYKDGCFSRYKDKKFTEKEIVKFIGNKRLYSPQEKEKINI